jgi:membrane protein YdbS with pleckstrin-like domain
MIQRMHNFPVGSAMRAAIVLIAAVAAHAGAWSMISQHLGLSSALASVLIAIVVVRHLGWISGAYVLLRRRRASHQ